MSLILFICHWRYLINLYCAASLMPNLLFSCREYLTAFFACPLFYADGTWVILDMLIMICLPSKCFVTPATLERLLVRVSPDMVPEKLASLEAFPAVWTRESFFGIDLSQVRPLIHVLKSVDVVCSSERHWNFRGCVPSLARRQAICLGGPFKVGTFVNLGMVGHDFFHFNRKEVTTVMKCWWFCSWR